MWEHTSRKIHEASDMEPKTPDKASWVVNDGPWASSAAKSGIAMVAGNGKSRNRGMTVS